MLKFIYCGRGIIIDLPMGIFSFGNESAQGKTFLFKIIRSKPSLHEIIAFTYNDFLIGVDYKKIIQDKRPRYILFDRYDLCESLIDDRFIREISKTTSIMLDNKHANNFWDVEEICTIHFDDKSLEVNYDNL